MLAGLAGFLKLEDVPQDLHPKFDGVQRVEEGLFHFLLLLLLLLLFLLLLLLFLLLFLLFMLLLHPVPAAQQALDACS